jgi:hypothetical protein
MLWTAVVAAVVLALPLAVRAEEHPATTNQLLMLYFTDSGRSFGYQVMMARIQVDTVKAELARDAALLRQNEELYSRNAIPEIELQIAQLKDEWNRKQITVAEKNLAYVSAEYDAMRQMAGHFAGGTVSVEEIYATFRRGWEAGCDKGPDEVVAHQGLDGLCGEIARTRSAAERARKPA